MVVRARSLVSFVALTLVASLVPAGVAAAPPWAAALAASTRIPSPAATALADAARVPPARPPVSLSRTLNGGLATLAEASGPVAAGIRTGPQVGGAGSWGPELPVSITTAPGARGGVEAALASLGGRVANADVQGVEAYVPVRSLATLAGVAGVEQVDPILPHVPAGTLADAVTLQGGTAWQAAGTSGAGVRVGIIDGGFSGIHSLLGVDLPATVHARCYTAVGVFTADLSVCEQGDQPHGTAVAESVAAMAPAASLWVADPTSQDDLLSTIDWMTSNGVRIINASWTDTGFEGPGDGTSPYADTAYALVDRAVSEGALWVNAAGNSGEQGWIGPWREDANGWLEFSGTDTSNRLPLQQGDHVVVSLRWSDPWGHASDDYDLGLYQAGDPVPVASSSNLQNGTGDPVETLEYDVPSTGAYEISAHRSSGGAASRVQLLVQSEVEAPLEYHVAQDTLTAPADGRNPGMLVVGAVDVSAPSTVEPYSSQGPTLDGRVKPDLVAVDCADTRTIATFCGTSEATPFVAGAAADVLSAHPGWTTAQLVQYLTQHATAIGSPVPNSAAGYGRLTLGPPPNVPASLRFAEPPIGGLAGAPLVPQPAVEIVDELGQRVAAGPGATLSVTLGAATVAPGGAAGTPGAALAPDAFTCTGGTTVAAVAGLAQFTGCTIRDATPNVVLTATAAAPPAPGSPALAPATSSAFDVDPATTPVPTLTVSPAASTITWGSGVSLAVQLAVPPGGPPVQSRQVQLQASADAVNWRAIATLSTGSSGEASFEYRPATNLWYRAIAPASVDLGPTISPPARVLVRQIALLRPAYGTATRTIAQGSTVTFTTTIRPARPELPAPAATYRLYRLVSGRWVLARQQRVAVDVTGVASFAWRFLTTGRWYVVAAAVPTPLNANSAWSPPDRVLVR